MIDLIITNERALAIKTPEARSILDSYLSYTTTDCKIDKHMTRLKKKTVYKWDIINHTHRMDEGSPFYVIARGLAELLPDDEFNKIYETTHKLIIPDDLSEDYIKNVVPGYELRSYQIEAVQKSLFFKRGINQLATGVGKSLIICAIFKILLEFNPDAKFLLIVPYEHLQDTFAGYFEKAGLSYEYSSNITGTKSIVIGMAVSMINRSSYLPIFNGVVYDECQHLQSDSWLAISMGSTEAEIALGFSAKVVEPKNIFNKRISKFSESEALAIGATGNVITYMSASLCIKLGILATPVLITIKNYLSESLKEEINWQKSLQEGLMDPKRTDTIADVANLFTSFGRRVLVLATTHQQSYDIASSIMKSRVPGLVVGISHGGNKGYLYKPSDKEEEIYEVTSIEGSEVINKFKNKEISILIGTSHIDEGADLPDLDVCLLAGAGKKSRRLIQKVGRSLRISKTGNYAYLIDFEDNNSKILHKHYLERMRTYVSDIGLSSDRMYKGVEVESISDIIKNLEEII